MLTTCDLFGQDGAVTTPARLATYFVSHGGGPWPWIDDMAETYAAMHSSLAAMPSELAVTPRAILCVSAHWEGAAFTVQTGANPPMLYDYGGFPEHTYRVQYGAAGSPTLAARATELLAGADLPVADDSRRGYDHGCFVPLYVAWPNADIPVVQLSLHQSLDPALHLAAGRALAPLRDEGVLIVGSGFSFHNLRTFFSPAAGPTSQEFDAWLADAVLNHDPAERTERLMRWESAPSARAAHPREEHLLPLMVAVGAAESEPARRVYDDQLFGYIRSASYRFSAS